MIFLPPFTAVVAVVGVVVLFFVAHAIADFLSDGEKEW